MERHPASSIFVVAVLVVVVVYYRLLFVCLIGTKETTRIGGRAGDDNSTHKQRPQEVVCVRSRERETRRDVPFFVLCASPQMTRSHRHPFRCLVLEGSLCYDFVSTYGHAYIHCPRRTRENQMFTQRPACCGASPRTHATMLLHWRVRRYAHCFPPSEHWIARSIERRRKHAHL